MKHFPLLMAGFCIDLCAEHDFVIRQCMSYRGDFAPYEADFSVSVTPAELAAEVANEIETVGDVARSRVRPHCAGYIESVCLYRKICAQIPSRGAFLFHAAVISDGGRGYAFAAPSGTGKSTHIRLWRKTFGQSIRVINGDKPLLRKVDGVWRAYGTPWCGKEGWQTNTSAPLTGICFLERGVENRIESLSVAEAVLCAVRQIMIPSEAVEISATLALLDDVICSVPLYRMMCTMEEEAARVARAGMT